MTNDVVNIPNRVRTFMIYDNLLNALDDYVSGGDGYHAVAVFDEDVYDDSSLMDVTAINLAKFLATSFGLAHLDEAMAIAKALQYDSVRKVSKRFRSAHPLFVNGTPLYQNVCLISGMIHLEIPILPYFNGQDVLVEWDATKPIDVERVIIGETKTTYNTDQTTESYN